MIQSTEVERLQQARFEGDARGEEVLRSDGPFSRLIETANAAASATSVRRHFLSNAVRIDPRVLPALAEAFNDVRQRTQITGPMEAYIHAGTEINACVIRGRQRMIVVLSSGAVERLSPKELDFIIGHELGHAAFGHLEIPVGAILNTPNAVTPRQAMQLLAWQRKAEISADRAGLLCAGSLDVAATSLFKTLSGLCADGICVDPQEFAGQWNELAEEVQRDGAGDRWLATHPFPPLRMKALISFWQSDRAANLIPDAPGGTTLTEADQEVESLLAMMDPLSRERADMADPMLQQFFLWGGLYVAMANHELHDSELANLRSVVGHAVDEVLTQGELSLNLLRQRFHDEKAGRRAPLSALELHRIFSGLAAVAAADGAIDQTEVAALRDLAGVCGVADNFVDVVLARAA
jgi:Zn-dependent protease with chaperone function/uncharacterized tellurite resistance protein B-like protein